MLSKSSKYAIKAVLFLALNTTKDKKLMVKDIFEPINVPQAYIAKLLQELSRKQIISSSRGSKGGFFLSKANRTHTIMDIIRALDTEKGMETCLLSLKYCDDKKPCPLHQIMDPYRSELLGKLTEKTIEELSNEIKAGKTFLPL